MVNPTVNGYAVSLLAAVYAWCHVIKSEVRPVSFQKKKIADLKKMNSLEYITIVRSLKDTM
jgi:hypothetical protein